MISKSKIDKLIPILKKDLRRTLRMHLAGFPNPYYSSFLLIDTNWFNTWAGSGSVFRRRSDHTRNVYSDIRVGSYRYDQVSNGGLFDNDEEVESYSQVSVPIDDKDYAGLRIGLWRLTDAKFREAISEYNSRKASSISTVDQYKHFRSFCKMKRNVSVKYARPEYIDETKWVRFCKNASKWISELSGVTSGWVEFDATQVTRIFVNTEGSVIVQHKQVYSLIATLRKLTKEGSHLEQELVYNCGTQKELPAMRTFKRLIKDKYDILMELSKAKKIHSFSGPVLLYPTPAGLLIHEAVGHRLEGSRLLSSDEGQTFKGQIGKQIIKVPLTVRDDPNIRTFDGQRCIGSYRYDDEGTKAEDALLIEDGILKGFLSTRAQDRKKGYKPNGHARTKKHQRPISRMGVTIIEGQEAVPLEELKEQLVEEIKAQGKPFGMIVYETSGGETDTTSYDFQAFSGEISYATLVYPNGKEVTIRGVDFVGTPLQALNNIIGVSSERELNNGFCGAESGFLPITTISPGILLKNLELQTKTEELVTQYILPKPRVS